MTAACWSCALGILRVLSDRYSRGRCTFLQDDYSGLLSPKMFEEFFLEEQEILARYLEQPTERDVTRHIFSMDEVARMKPVLADEGVTDLKSFDSALKLGWSGVAVKACKWHWDSLIYIAKMEHYKIPYSIQDLTCTGLALVHSAR